MEIEILQNFMVGLYNSFGGIALAIMFIVLAYLMIQAKDLEWTDLVTSKGSHNVSLTKFLQLIGGLTGTWMVIYMTLHDKLTYDILLVYLTYVGAIDGWSKYVAAKFSPGIKEEKVIKKSSPKEVKSSTTE